MISLPVSSQAARIRRLIPFELTEAQNKLAQQSFDDFMAGATKISEISVKVCGEAFEPLNAQMNTALKKASEAAAA